MAKTNIQQLFDRVLQLEEGEEIILKFPDALQLASKKMLLFREKAKYERQSKNYRISC